jgi:histidine triad (HIT) family protein
MSNFIPIERLRETNNLIAFHHHEPTYPVHILIVPKRSIRTFMDLTTMDAGLIMEIMQTAQSLVEEFKLQEVGYRLIINRASTRAFPSCIFTWYRRARLAN